jgi:ribosome biogenesis GTPase
MSKKKGKKTRIDLRKNREKSVRAEEDLTERYLAGDPELEDMPQIESVRAKGERSRKRTLFVIDDGATIGGLRDGIITTMRGLIAEVDEAGRSWPCVVRRLLRTRMIRERHPVSVGDAVRFRAIDLARLEVEPGEDASFVPEGVIEEVLPRRTALTRLFERRVQVLAANVDQVVIVVAADQPPLRPHLIDRYLVAIHQGGMRPLICINKADLDEHGEAADVVARYAALGYRSFLVSVTRGDGLDALRAELKDSTLALVGPSGVGKSSILNALEPGLGLKIGTLTDQQRGKHTTTTARLIRWSLGGFVVDTPGLRQFEPADLEAGDLEAYFIEFAPLVGSCRYPNCSHRHEEGCAIREAVVQGGVSPERYDSYCKMYEECAEKPKY